MAYEPRNGSSHAAERFRLAMAIVSSDHELSPEVQRAAKATATRLESYHPSQAHDGGHPRAFSESPKTLSKFPASPSIAPRSRDAVSPRLSVKERQNELQHKEQM